MMASRHRDLNGNKTTKIKMDSNKISTSTWFITFMPMVLVVF